MLRVIALSLFLTGCGEARAGFSHLEHAAAAALTNTPLPLDSPEVTAEAVSWKMHALRAIYEGCTPTRSVGKPWGGRLKCGELLPTHGRIQPMSMFQFGTVQSNRAIIGSADYLDTHDPDGPMIQVFDISKEGGGLAPHHISHQTGRDVDYALFYKDGFQPPLVFMDVPFERVDLARLWLLIEGLLETNDIKIILIDHELQGLLYPYAEAQGTVKMKKVFQWPRELSKKVGILRHYPNHGNHIHVRFKCPKGHGRCRG